PTWHRPRFASSGPPLLLGCSISLLHWIQPLHSRRPSGAEWKHHPSFPRPARAGACDNRSKNIPAMSGNVTFLGDFSKKLVTNTFFNLLGRCWSFVLTLLLTPYILSHLGVRDFGTWALLSIFISPYFLLDFGLSSSLVMYISEYYTYDDDDRINRVL